MAWDDIGPAAAADLTGASTDDNGVLISASENVGSPVAVGFRAQKANGAYRYFWLYRVKFGLPATNLQTKANNITFSTPTIEGTVMRRNKLDGLGKQKLQLESAGWDEQKKRIADMSSFLREQPTAITEYDEPLVRRLIEKVTVYTASADAADKFTVEWGSGMTVDVDE